MKLSSVAVPPLDVVELDAEDELLDEEAELSPPELPLEHPIMVHKAAKDING